MSEIIVIYLLIGFAHWGSHIIQCKRCRDTAAGNVVLVLEGITYVCGWPAEVLHYFSQWRMSRDHLAKLGLALLNGEEIDDPRITRITLRREDGESDEDFKTRTTEEAMKKIKEMAE